MAITFEEANETLKAGDLSGLTYSLIPYLIWKTISMGAHKRTVFLQAVVETDMLVGVEGDAIHIPYLKGQEFEAKEITEDEIDNTGFIKTKLTPKSVRVKIADVVYVATRISDILLEDSPRLGWVRASLVKMGEAMAEKIDAAVRDCLINGAGNSRDATNTGTLTYEDVVKLKTMMRTDSFFESEGGPFLMFIHPEQEEDLLLTFGKTISSTGIYVPVERYSVGNVPLVAERGTFAGCRVLVTDNMTKGKCLVVAPPTHAFGPPAIFAWKRHLKSESWRDEQYGRDLWLLSARYECAVVQSDGVGLINDC